jgi:Family of unknown function (DUF6049)
VPRPSSPPHAVALVATAVICAALSGLVGAGAGASGPVVPASVVTSGADTEQPLVPRIRSITPDYVPESGPIVIRGRVTNASDQRWTAINVHGFMGSTPITAAAQLSEEAKTPVDADVGDRITQAGTFDRIRSLAPGQSASFRVRLPHSTLPVSGPGVYWFGVHVLGDDGEGGGRVAVGRDRTFLPYLPKASIHRGREDAALVLPIRAGVTRGPDGAVADPDEWEASLRSGPLRSVVSTGQAARDRPLTWLLDPAVPDVVRRLAQGNPARTLTSPKPPGSESPSPASPTGSPTASDASAAGATASRTVTARVARQWLHEVRPLLGADSGEVLGLPYGDLAVESAARFGAPLLNAAFQRTLHALGPWGVALNRVVAPPDGRTDGDAFEALPRDADILLSDSGVDQPASVVNRINGHRVVLTSSAALQGGPGPVAPRSSLALRQRILAEAALRLLGDRQPLIVELPADLRAPLRASFFQGLEVPWLRLTTLDGATAVSPAPLDVSSLRDRPPAEPELGPGLYLVASHVLERARALQSVVSGNQDLSRRLFEEVTGNASYAASSTPFIALSRMRGTERWVQGNLDQIDLAAPESVTLASDSGRFLALISNDLDVPVTVKVHAISDPRLTITGGEAVRLAPHGRTTVPLHASTHQRGVHTVTLELTNADGVPLGIEDRFPMRAEQVSRLIWVIIGAGLALLFTAIAVRLVRRILGARARHGSKA